MIGFDQHLGQEVRLGNLHVVHGLQAVGVQGSYWEEVVVELLLEHPVVKEHVVALEDGKRESVEGSSRSSVKFDE